MAEGPPYARGVRVGHQHHRAMLARTSLRAQQRLLSKQDSRGLRWTSISILADHTVNSRRSQSMLDSRLLPPLLHPLPLCLLDLPGENSRRRHSICTLTFASAHVATVSRSSSLLHSLTGACAQLAQACSWALISRHWVSAATSTECREPRCWLALLLRCSCASMRSVHPCLHSSSRPSRHSRCSSA